MQTFKIEPYHRQYYDQVSQFITSLSQFHPDESNKYLSTLGDNNAYLAIKDDTILAVCKFDHRVHESRGHTLDIDIKTNDQISPTLLLNSYYPLILESINTHQSEFIVISCEESEKQMISFWEDKGFSTWFILKTMVHDGRSLPKHNLSFRNYEDSDFDMYFRALGQAFEPMRRAMDITPFNVSHVSDEKRSKEREAFFKERDNILLFFERDSFVGTAIIDGREIDDVYVTEAFQGKGYGRKIMDVVMNLAMEKNDQPIQLTVVDWNVKAKKLYHSLGFHVIKTEVFLRKLIHH